MQNQSALYGKFITVFGSTISANLLRDLLRYNNSGDNKAVEVFSIFSEELELLGDKNFDILAEKTVFGGLEKDFLVDYANLFDFSYGKYEEFVAACITKLKDMYTTKSRILYAQVIEETSREVFGSPAGNMIPSLFGNYVRKQFQITVATTNKKGISLVTSKMFTQETATQYFTFTADALETVIEEYNVNGSAMFVQLPEAPKFSTNTTNNDDATNGYSKPASYANKKAQVKTKTTKTVDGITYKLDADGDWIETNVTTNGKKTTNNQNKFMDVISGLDLDALTGRKVSDLFYRAIMVRSAKEHSPIAKAMQKFFDINGVKPINKEQAAKILSNAVLVNNTISHFTGGVMEEYNVTCE